MCTHTVSGWQKAATVATYIQVVVVGFSLFFIWSQLKNQTRQLDQQVKLSRASNTQAMVQLLTPLNLRVTDRTMAELWVKKDSGIDQLPDLTERAVLREQYQTLLASYMVFYENAYSQYCAGLLEQEIYEGWDKDLSHFLQEHQISRNWNDWKTLYRKDFRDRVSAMIASGNLGPPKLPCPK